MNKPLKNILTVSATALLLTAACHTPKEQAVAVAKADTAKRSVMNAGDTSAKRKTAARSTHRSEGEVAAKQDNTSPRYKAAPSPGIKMHPVKKKATTN